MNPTTLKGGKNMKINKWFGKLNIRFEIRWKRHYRHTFDYKMRKVSKDDLIFGNGFMKVDWIRPWQFWKRGWKEAYWNKVLYQREGY